MAIGSVVNAAPKTEVFCLWGGYGSVTGARSYPRSRLWLLAESADPDARLVCRIGFNHPRGGQVVYDDLGGVASARLRTSRWIEVVTLDNQTVGQVLAPCVCGAGAVGFAGPQTGRHYVTMLNPLSHSRVESG